MGVGPNRPDKIVLRQQNQAVARVVGSLIFPADAVRERQIPA